MAAIKPELDGRIFKLLRPAVKLRMLAPQLLPLPNPLKWTEVTPALDRQWKPMSLNDFDALVSIYAPLDKRETVFGLSCR
jgi:hypothetical protein